MILEIRGSNFIFPKYDPEVGVFVVTENREKPSMIIHCENSKNIKVLLPDEIPQEEVRLKVVVRFQHHQSTAYCFSELMPVVYTSK